MARNISLPTSTKSKRNRKQKENKIKQKKKGLTELKVLQQSVQVQQACTDSSSR